MGELRQFVPREITASIDGSTALKLSVAEPYLRIVDDVFVAEQDAKIKDLSQYRQEKKTAEVVFDFSEDFLHLQRLRDQWNMSLRAVGIDPKEDEVKNYDPVKARFNFERARKKGQVAQFRHEESVQLTTALRERYNAAESRMNFLIENNQLVSEQWKEAGPLSKIYWFGYEVRKQENSQELERDYQDVVGQNLKIEPKLIDENTPIGTKFALISPPGQVEGTIYGKNFVKLYEAALDENGKRYIKFAQFAVTTDAEKYKSIATKLQPDYFAGHNEAKVPKERQVEGNDYTEYPIDAWFVGHPIEIPATADYTDLDDLFLQEFAPGTGLSEERFQAEVNKPAEPLKVNYLLAVEEEEFKPDKVAKWFNAILNAPEDKEWRQVVASGRIVADINNLAIPSGVHAFASIHNRLQNQEVKTVAGACGSSSGFNSSGSSMFENPLKKVLENTVGMKGLGLLLEEEDEYGKLTFIHEGDEKNPGCGKLNRRSRGKLLEKCQHCNKSVKC